MCSIAGNASLFFCELLCDADLGVPWPVLVSYPYCLVYGIRRK